MSLNRGPPLGPPQERVTLRSKEGKCKKTEFLPPLAAGMEVEWSQDDGRRRLVVPITQDKKPVRTREPEP